MKSISIPLVTFLYISYTVSLDADIRLANCSVQASVCLMPLFPPPPQRGSTA